MRIFIKFVTVLLVLALTSGWLAAVAVADTSVVCEQPQWCGAATDINGTRASAEGGNYTYSDGSGSFTGAYAGTSVRYILAGKGDYSDWRGSHSFTGAVADTPVAYIFAGDQEGYLVSGSFTGAYANTPVAYIFAGKGDNWIRPGSFTGAAAGVNAPPPVGLIVVVIPVEAPVE